ncbi:M3 family metallopeptidase [Clostridium folliculivorans]|uniref:Oligoendopeptidase F n=1 Tax=Clostridium folliculivorans TaxID=2886038 RepID=A0A9W5Y060_9CLOT|nr:M3 family metallopeptidase [Clostridium folliculivorans]GKU24160.1 oligoendopeptidase F [Clostridium folliculivorans]GKU30265.1 oligoendopeptidase F [Clostridium folliculivorans]
MRREYNLEDLYSGFDCKEFEEDLTALQENIDLLYEYAKDDFGSSEDINGKLNIYIQMSEEIVNAYTKLTSYCYLRYYANSDDREAIGFVGQIEQIYAKYIEAEALFKKWLKGANPNSEELEWTEGLKAYSYYIKSKTDEAKHTLGDKEEYLISSMKSVGSDAWRNLYYELFSSLQVEVKVKDKVERVPFSVAESMLANGSKEEKQRIFKAELEALKSIENISATCLNNIKQEALILSKIRGYDSILEETAAKSKMDLQTLELAMSKLQENLPILQKYYKVKAKAMGYPQGLPFYEIISVKLENNKKFTLDEAKDLIVESVNDFSIPMAKFMERAFNSGWIDSEVRSKKFQGNFCMPILPIKQIRVSTNFTEDISSILSLAHELGHGYHFYCMREESILNSEVPMAIIETPSIFSTTVVNNALMKNANAKLQIELLGFDLDCIIGDILVMYSRYIFEKQLFEARRNKILTAAELNNLMISAQNQAFGDSLDENYLNQYAWITKSQYYNADNNFYNFPYIFGDLLSKVFYAMYLEKGQEFVNKYERFLAGSGKGDLRDILRIVDIDINNPGFWDNTYKIIGDMIDRYIGM